MVSPDRQYRLVAQSMGAAVIADWFRSYKHRQRLARARAEIATRPLGHGVAHGLPAPLVVSLTSYSARFPTLALTLRALLSQSVVPDRVILWMDAEDEAKLPPDVLELTENGLEIRVCPDWKSYKKIVPTLLEFPHTYIATADDDAYYAPDWLEKLVQASLNGAPIVCHRAHWVTLGKDGKPAPYSEWTRNIAAPERGSRVFLTGVSGVLYAPGVFHADVTRDELFMRLAPNSDDVWLYFMHRLNGVTAQKIGGKVRILEWEGSQAQNLRQENTTGAGNDRAVIAMIEAYGWPD